MNHEQLKEERKGYSARLFPKLDVCKKVPRDQLGEKVRKRPNLWA